MRFRGARPTAPTRFAARRPATWLDLLAGFAGCAGVELGRRVRRSRRSGSWSSAWESVGELPQGAVVVRGQAAAVPFLSRAIDEPTAFEVLYGGEGSVRVGERAGDAATVDLAR